MITGIRSSIHSHMKVSWFLFTLLACNFRSAAEEISSTEPVKVIYETDMTLDSDDVGALAMLHALADSGIVDLLAVCYNEVHVDGAAAIDAMNTWYGRGDLPVGVYKGYLNDPHWSSYLSVLADYFPNDLTNETAPDAVDVYRNVLQSQPDSSVVIISVGFVNNLSNLVDQEYDLVSKKVKLLTQMGCGGGFNINSHDLEPDGANVLEHWPSKLICTELGDDIITGDEDIIWSTPAESPFREAYIQNGPRPSWDQVTVLSAVPCYQDMFVEITDGTLSWGDYQADMAPGYRVRWNGTVSENLFHDLITDLMSRLPNPNKAPTDISISADSVDENQPAGTTVGSFSTIDMDAGDSHTYSLVYGTGDGFSINGSNLETTAEFDYETKSSYNIRVQTDDGNGGKYQKQFNICVRDQIHEEVGIAFGEAVTNRSLSIYCQQNGEMMSLTMPGLIDNVTLMYLNGRIIMQRDELQSRYLNIERLQAGIYYLEVTDKKGNVLKKKIIKL